MADLNPAVLTFDHGCPDCGDRVMDLPAPPPAIADDFDWETRDYDSFRLFMMQELAHRAPQRARWTAADMEVVLVELLAAGLDRLSGALDAVFAEGFLETARRPASVRKHLTLIGYDLGPDRAAALAAGLDPPTLAAPDTEARSDLRLDRYWTLKPLALESARRRGPELIRAQARMVTLADHAATLERHPVVARAVAKRADSPGWPRVRVPLQLRAGERLDAPLTAALDARLRRAIVDHHRAEDLPAPVFDAALTARRLLGPLIERRRMLGTEVAPEDAREAPITFWLSVRSKSAFYRSELRRALAQVFEAADGGLLEVGRLGFGDDVFASDLIEAAMAVDGVETACLNLFKRQGGGWPNRAVEGFIPIDPDEIAVCLNRPGQPERGAYRITVVGGLPG